MPREVIDYKALAERVAAMARSYEDRARVAHTTQEDRTSDRHAECADDLRVVVSLLEGMADAKPALWMQSNHVSWAGKQPFMARCAPTQLHPDFVPVYLHPAPQPTAIPAPFMHLLGHAYGLSLGTDWNRGTHAKHYRRPLLDAVAECKRWLGSAPPPQPEPAQPKRRPYGTDTMSEMGIAPMCDEPQSERQPVSEPTETQIEAAAWQLCVCSAETSGVDPSIHWPIYQTQFRMEANRVLRAALAAKDEK